MSHQLYHPHHPPPKLTSKSTCCTHSPQHKLQHIMTIPPFTIQFSPISNLPTYYDTKEPLLLTILRVNLRPILPPTKIFLANITPSLKTLSYIPHTLFLQPINLKTTYPLPNILVDIPPPSILPLSTSYSHAYSIFHQPSPIEMPPPNLISYK